MQTTRQQKIARLVQKDLSDIFLRYARAIPGTLISVSEVRVSPDLAVASIYLSIFDQSTMAGTAHNSLSGVTIGDSRTFHQIVEDTPKIRLELGNLERHQLRIIPELRFFLDETLDKMERIDQLLGK